MKGRGQCSSKPTAECHEQSVEEYRREQNKFNKAIRKQTQRALKKESKLARRETRRAQRLHETINPIHKNDEDLLDELNKLGGRRRSRKSRRKH
jgi:hypothetical protein